MKTWNKFPEGTNVFLSQKEWEKIRMWLWLRGIPKNKFLWASLKNDISENRHLLPALQKMVSIKEKELENTGGEEDGN